MRAVIQLSRVYSAMTHFRQADIIKTRKGKSANLRAHRWRGPEANYYSGPPKLTSSKAVKAYKECIDPKWAGKSEANAQVYHEAAPSPEHWGFWSVNIRDEHLYEDDRGELADDEKEGDALGDGDDDDEL